MKQVLIAIDQLINTLFKGWADETISARSYRNKDKSSLWKKVYVCINMVFFMQEDHCKTAYESEKKRRQLPVEYRL